MIAMLGDLFMLAFLLMMGAIVWATFAYKG
jgi:hypothetical protein